MALIKLDRSIESIHGRFGGVYFKKDSSGQHIQAMPKGITITSFHSQHALLTFAFTKVSQFWKMLIATGMALYWISFAKEHLYGREEKHKRLDGRKWFIAANCARVARDLLPINDPYWWFQYGRYIDYNVRGGESTHFHAIFQEGGIFRERPFYYHPTGPWVLWFDGIRYWVISHFMGVLGDEYWQNDYILQPGDYSPGGVATGIVYVWAKRPYYYVD